MKKYLITGFSGFVSKYFIEHLHSIKQSADILGIDMIDPEIDYPKDKNFHIHFEKLDLLHQEELENLLYQFQPDYIIHLASYSSVGFSWKNPVLSFQNNTNILLNILETVRKLGLNSRILSIGSSEEYGIVDNSSFPLRENMALNPVSPYAVARVSQEMLSRIYAQSYGLDIIMTRSFNHFGPRQRDIFVIPSFAKQMVEIKNNNQEEGVLKTGNVSIIRDFLDVRDVVKAYYLLLEKGGSGEIYNVCSGKGTSLKEIIDQMAEVLNIDVKIDVDPGLIRPGDNPIIIGSNEKITKSIDWQTTYTLEKSIREIIQYWESIV